MGAYLVFTESGPILVLTSYPTILDDRVVAALRRRGVDRFIAYEVPVEVVHRVYGLPFELVASELGEGLPLRVLDFNGPHVFSSFSLSDLGNPVAFG